MYNSDGNKRNYAVDKLKTAAFWPWIFYEGSVDDYRNPRVGPADWWEDTLMGSIGCVVWVMVVIVALAGGIATCNCVFDHQTPKNPPLVAAECDPQ